MIYFFLFEAGKALSNFWIGGTNLGSDDSSFYWMGNETPMNDYTNWYPNEPNNWSGNEYCVEIYPAYAARWNDRMCSLAQYFICEEYENNTDDSTIVVDPSE